MDRLEFLHILNKSLKKVPKEERENAIAFYDEFFADANSEEEAIEALPHPKKIAAKIIMEVGEKQSKLSISTIVLAICSAPITMPIGLSVLAVALSLLITFICLILVPYIVFGSFVLCTLPLAIACIPAFLFNYQTGLVFLGMTLCFFSVGMLGLIGFHKLAKIIFGFFRKLFLKLGKRSYENEK
ncbi:MAG: DUF1700 domain-containing protein [Clostridia bacterium]